MSTSSELIVARAEIKAKELRWIRLAMSWDMRELCLLHCLIMHLGGLNMSRYRVCEVSEFSNVSSSVDIDALRVIVERGISRGKIGRQTTVHSGVHQLSGLRKEELADMVKCHTRLFHCVRH